MTILGLAWISTDWNPSNAGFGKGFQTTQDFSAFRYSIW